MGAGGDKSGLQIRGAAQVAEPREREQVGHDGFGLQGGNISGVCRSKHLTSCISVGQHRAMAAAVAAVAGQWQQRRHWQNRHQQQLPTEAGDDTGLLEPIAVQDGLQLLPLYAPPASAFHPPPPWPLLHSPHRRVGLGSGNGRAGIHVLLGHSPGKPGPQVIKHRTVHILMLGTLGRQLVAVGPEPARLRLRGHALLFPARRGCRTWCLLLLLLLTCRLLCCAAWPPSSTCGRSCLWCWAGLLGRGHRLVAGLDCDEPSAQVAGGDRVQPLQAGRHSGLPSSLLTVETSTIKHARHSESLPPPATPASKGPRANGRKKVLTSIANRKSTKTAIVQSVCPPTRQPLPTLAIPAPQQAERQAGCFLHFEIIVLSSWSEGI